MRTCDHCGAPVHANWDYCHRCMADLTPVDDEATSSEPPSWQTRPAPAVTAADLGTRVRGLAARMRPSSNGPRTSLAANGEQIDRLREARVPAWSLLAVAGAFVALLFIAMTVTSGTDGSNEQEAEAQASAESEIARLTSALATAETTRVDLERQISDSRDEVSRLQASATTAASEVGDLEAQAESLRTELEAAQATLDENAAELESQQSAISVLSECLSGMEVALSFALDGRFEPAERAMESVANACAAAREFL